MECLGYLPSVTSPSQLTFRPSAGRDPESRGAKRELFAILRQQLRGPQSEGRTWKVPKWRSGCNSSMRPIELLDLHIIILIHLMHPNAVLPSRVFRIASRPGRSSMFWTGRSRAGPHDQSRSWTTRQKRDLYLPREVEQR